MGTDRRRPIPRRRTPRDQPNRGRRRSPRCWDRCPCRPRADVDALLARLRGGRRPVAATQSLETGIIHPAITPPQITLRDVPTGPSTTFPKTERKPVVPSLPIPCHRPVEAEKEQNPPRRGTPFFSRFIQNSATSISSSSNAIFRARTNLAATSLPDGPVGMRSACARAPPLRLPRNHERNLLR